LTRTPWGASSIATQRVSASTQVAVHHPVPLVGRGFEQVAAAHHPRGVDQPVEAAAGLDRATHPCRAHALVPHVAGHGDRPAAGGDDLLGGLLQTILAPARGDHRAARRTQRPRAGPADPAAGAGHQEDFVLHAVMTHGASS
jgi:hypothetical protein